MTTRVRIQGVDQLLAELQGIADDVDDAMVDVLRGTSQNIRSHAVISIQRGPKTGRLYIKENPHREHRASAPGEAPATDTGRLAGSIQAQIDGLSAEIFTNLEYAPKLEFGDGRVAPRPFMVPAMEKERQPFERRVRRALKGVINRRQGGAA